MQLPYEPAPSTDPLQPGALPGTEQPEQQNIDELFKK